MKPLILCLSLILAPCAFAKGGHGSKPSSAGYGTGSKSESVTVNGYQKQDGTYVASSPRSTPDSTTKNNWSTKPNANPYTGKEGTRVTPPAKDAGK